MISETELYEAGYISSEHKDSEITYVEFSKFLKSGIEIHVTHEIDKESDIVDLCYVELGIEMSYRILGNITTIEQVKQLEVLLAGTDVFPKESRAKNKQLDMFP